MTIEDIFQYVASMGLWAKDGTYVTKGEGTDAKENAYVVYNAYSFLEKDRCSDAVLIEVGTNGKGKIRSIGMESWCDACDMRFRKFYGKALADGALDRYAVDMGGIVNGD